MKISASFWAARPTAKPSPAGCVVDTDPKPNSMRVVGTEIKLTLSIGPKTTPVPDVAGEHKDTARARLENAGFTVQPISESSDTVAADFVIRTDPPRRPGGQGGGR